LNLSAPFRDPLDMAISDEFSPILTDGEPSLPAEAPTREALRDVVINSSRSSNQAIRRFKVRMDALETQMARLLKQVGTVINNAKEQAGEITGMDIDQQSE
jgi:hypothetical protein